MSVASQPDVHPGALVAMVCMVAITWCFDVADALNQQKTKVMIEKKH
jgi:hypothetical protein